MTFDLSDYVDVAEREHMLFERYPDSRTQVELEEVRNGAGDIVAWKAKATIWRGTDDPIPVCDYAVEPVPGKTPYTRDSEAMNASTSAVGRAIILAGFPSKKIASVEEVRNRSEEPRPDGSLAGSSDNPVVAAREAYLKSAADAQAPGAVPSEQVIHFGKNKGIRLGDLTPGQLKWYANEWKVQADASAYDSRLKLAAQALHAGSDSADFDLPFA